jgi:hypothetical protein
MSIGGVIEIQHAGLPPPEKPSCYETGFARVSVLDFTRGERTFQVYACSI